MLNNSFRIRSHHSKQLNTIKGPKQSQTKSNNMQKNKQIDKNKIFPNLSSGCIRILNHASACSKTCARMLEYAHASSAKKSKKSHTYRFNQIKALTHKLKKHVKNPKF